MKIYQKDNMLEATRPVALNNIINYINKILGNIDHPSHHIQIGKSEKGDCVIVQFDGTDVSYRIYPQYNGKVTGSNSKTPISIQANYPNATYNPRDHSFYNGKVQIGKAYVSVNAKNYEDYSEDINDAEIYSNGKVSSAKDLLKKIGADTDSSNRIPNP